jgi:WD40 repeat protein
VLAQKVVIPRYLNDIESVSAPGTSELVLGYGYPGYGVALTTLPEGKMVGMKSRAMDVWNGTMIAEAADGSVALAKLGNTDAKLEKRVTLPVSPLGTPRSVSLSSDGRYLAISNRSRGGVWDLSTGNRVFLLHGFTDSHWADNGKLYADFPKLDKVERSISEMSMAEHSIRPLTYKVDDNANMYEGWLMEWKSGKAKGGSGMPPQTLTLHNPADDAVLWSKEFPEGRPAFTASSGGRDLIFSYGLKSNTAKERLKVVPTLAAEAAAVKNKDQARLIEVVDGVHGTTSAEVVVELPVALTTMEGFDRAGDLLFAGGADGRTLVYSLTDGKQVRQIFGRVYAIDPESHRICVRNRMDEAVVYDETGNELAHFHMGSPVRFAEFREKGKQLFLLTADQKVRTMDLSAQTTANLAEK